MKKAPRMSRAHYVLLAQLCNEYAQEFGLTTVQWIMLANKLSNALVETNDNFDTDRFYAAATEGMDRPDKQKVSFPCNKELWY